MAEDSNEHLGSSVGSSGVSKARAERCVTHHFACDCNQYRYERMQAALIRILIWAEQDVISGESRSKAMADIAKACREGIYE